MSGPTTIARESLTIQPEPARWRELIRQNTSDEARGFRAQLGLPTDRPIIMAGHHTQLWHPGVVAKYLAADAAAGRTGAGVAWLMVDQDRSGSVPVRYPVVDADGRLAVREVAISNTSRAATASERTSADLREPACVAAGLDRIGAALSRHAGEKTFARQIAAAISDLLRPLLLHAPSPTTIFATELCRTSLFGDLVARMARDPESCCRTYNAAVARHPSARMRALIADEVQDRFELPLWHLPPGAARRHVYAEDLPSIPVHELAPKALFMTGLLRLAGCDLFIHGLGAGASDDAHEGYDHITGEWLSAWLGIEPSLPAPITVVTATRYLPLSIPEPPTPAAAARAVWLAHAAAHNPHIIRDGYFDDAKRRLVLQIAAAAHAQRVQLYRQMHALLDDYRRTHAADLDAIRGRAAAMQARLASAPIAFDRTWAFPLYPDHVLTALRDEIDAAFGLGR